MPKNNAFNQYLQALMDSKVAVLSLLDQIGIRSFKERELAPIIRKTAIALSKKTPSQAVPIAEPIPRARKPRRRRRK